MTNIEIKQTLFADDASFFTDVCPNLFQALIETLDSFLKNIRIKSQ